MTATRADALLGRLLRGWLLILMDTQLKVAPPAEADTDNPNVTTRRISAYELTIEAPPELRALLMEHLDLARFRDTPDDMRLTAAELRRLAAVAPEQATKLLETAGYFNAKVRPRRSATCPTACATCVWSWTPARARWCVRWTCASRAPQDRGRARRQAGHPLERTLMQSWQLPVQSASARATARAVVQADDNQVDIAVTLESGPLFTLGELTVEGLKHQPEESVRRLAGYQLHQPYNEKLLLDFQERLVGTQLFDSASVEIQPEAVTPPPGAESVEVPVTVKIARPPASRSRWVWASDRRRPQRQHRVHAPQALRPEHPRAHQARTGQDAPGAGNRSQLASAAQHAAQPGLGAAGAQDDNNQVNTNLSTRLVTPRRPARGPADLRRGAALLGAQADVQTTVAGAVSLNQQMTWRRLDSRVLPTKGWSATATVGGGWPTARRNPRARSRGRSARPTDPGQDERRPARGAALPHRRRRHHPRLPPETLAPWNSAGNLTGGPRAARWQRGVLAPAHAAHPAADGRAVPGRRQCRAETGATIVPPGPTAPACATAAPWACCASTFAKGNQVDKWRMHFSLAISL
ncbi:hypothetical protein Ddc_24622 [Ditylenchus destructor]|nr:hypothetical protein Ddc_24622 [Ditylenchus destructor]